MSAPRFGVIAVLGGFELPMTLSAKFNVKYLFSFGIESELGWFSFCCSESAVAGGDKVGYSIGIRKVFMFFS